MKRLTVKLAIAIFTFLVGIAAYSTYHYLQGAYQVWLRNHPEIKKPSPCDFLRVEVDKKKVSCPVAKPVQCP